MADRVIIARKRDTEIGSKKHLFGEKTEEKEKNFS